jgi:misacylated tRNA(Ala) deacylase
MTGPGPTELLYLDDAQLRRFRARVTAVDGDRIALDRTAFYATGGGQPHDDGRLADVPVEDVVHEGPTVWHHLAGPHSFAVGDEVEGEIDWERRHDLMRTHTAVHVLCGVIWNEWHVPVTGASMDRLQGRVDFAFDPLPEGFAATVERAVNHEIAADRPVRVSSRPRDEIDDIGELIRTRVNMVPDDVDVIRVVDIVGLDAQADGGTHVHATAEIGGFRVVKVENKGKGSKRVRFELSSAPS